MKVFIISLFSLLLVSAVFAQDTITTEQAAKPEQTPPRKDKIYFGGNLNLSFGSYTVVGLEPMLAYKITPKLSAGVKIRYDYISDKRYASTYTTSMYGGSIFTRYRLIPQLYVHAEYAGYNYELYNELGESNREWIPLLFLGAGYSQSLGGRSWLNAQILFDVLQSDHSPYKNWEPFYSVGVGVGF